MYKSLDELTGKWVRVNRFVVDLVDIFIEPLGVQESVGPVEVKVVP